MHIENLHGSWAVRSGSYLPVRLPELFVAQGRFSEK